MSVTLHTHAKRIRTLLDAGEFTPRTCDIFVRKAQTKGDYIEIHFNREVPEQFETMQRIAEYLKPFEQKIYLPSRHFYINRGINTLNYLVFLIQ